MPLPELEELLKDLRDEIKKMRPEDRPLVVVIPGTFHAYFNTL